MRPSRRDQFAIHQPVLSREVLELLALEPGLCVVDATIGAAGHSRQILEQIRPGGFLIGIDRDPMMLQIAARELGAPQADVTLKQSSYVALPDILAERQISRVDRVLADLGLSSDQLADDTRGFRFDADGPLDLRFDVSTGEPAHALLRSASAEELLRIFREYGEEPHSRRIADAIVERLRHTPIQTARQLAEIVVEAASGRRGMGKHPATQVFQALRIAVNDELRHVAELVNVILPQAVVSGGRAGVISFHSLEDRLVKQAFRNKALWQPVTAKPVTASSVERRQNPRARSAKLRVAVRA
ncbi:MAG: 16S rRNA (cytosine(1402)-N(4))-methyltransferase RsmH [Planctomycetaceae bacterium]